MTDLRINSASRGTTPLGKPERANSGSLEQETPSINAPADQIDLTRLSATKANDVVKSETQPTAPKQSTQPALPSIQLESSPKVLQEVAAPSLTELSELGPDLRKLSDNDLGAGFHAVEPRRRSAAQNLQTFLAHRANKPYECVVSKLLDKFSDTTKNGAGVDIEGLLNVERTLYQSLASSREGYKGGAAPLFQALADGQAAYVNLGPERQDDADHLMRMFANLPLATIEQMDDNGDDISKIRKAMVERAKTGEFPVFVDMDGDCEHTTPTESIATGIHRVDRPT